MSHHEDFAVSTDSTDRLIAKEEKAQGKLMGKADRERDFERSVESRDGWRKDHGSLLL